MSSIRGFVINKLKMDEANEVAGELARLAQTIPVTGLHCIMAR